MAQKDRQKISCIVEFPQGSEYRHGIDLDFFAGSPEDISMALRKLEDDAKALGYEQIYISPQLHYDEVYIRIHGMRMETDEEYAKRQKQIRDDRKAAKLKKEQEEIEASAEYQEFLRLKEKYENG